MTLPNAVEAVVSFFVDEKREFSIYDITTMIRADLLSGNYTVEHKSDSASIYHHNVKQEFLDALEDGVLGVEHKDTHNAPDGAPYRVYGKVDASQPTPSQNPITQPVNPANVFQKINSIQAGQSISAQYMASKRRDRDQAKRNPFALPNNTTTPSSPLTPTNPQTIPLAKKKVSGSSVVHGISNYLNGRDNPVTIKQIQSSLKRTGLTCNGIHKHLNAMTQVKVTPVDGGVSKYKVELV